jgi:hypothetical protein
LAFFWGRKLLCFLELFFLPCMMMCSCNEMIWCMLLMHMNGDGYICKDMARFDNSRSLKLIRTKGQDSALEYQSGWIAIFKVESNCWWISL